MNSLNEFQVSIADEGNLYSTSKKLLDATLDNLNTLLDNLKEDSQDNTDSFIKLTEYLNSFIQAVTVMHTNLKLPTELRVQNGLTIKQLQIHLLSVVKAIHAAWLKNDKIMLCDLIEFELKDNLTQWKISILPLVQKSKNL